MRKRWSSHFWFAIVLVVASFTRPVHAAPESAIIPRTADIDGVKLH